MKEKRGFRFTLYWKILLILASLTGILALLSCLQPFCNFYADHIYGVMNFLIGSVTTLCPISVGEILMYFGALVLILQVIFPLLLIFLRKKSGYRCFVKHFSKSVLMLFTAVLFLHAANWLVPFRAAPLKVSDSNRKTFSLEEMTTVYSGVVNQLNTIAEELERDENGNVLYLYTEEDIIRAMQNGGGEFPRLTGRYSHMKCAICSPFLEWMGIGGFNYVFAMEPVYNKFTSPLIYPNLSAHEYSHHKGYYQEDEAVFISCVVLSRSDNPLLRYSAYYEMLSYLDAAFEEAFLENQEEKYGPCPLGNGEMTEEAREWMMRYANERAEYPFISQRVSADFQRGYKIAQEQYEETVSPQLEETFQETAAEVGDKGWELQAEVVKEKTYEGSTLLFLQYFLDGNGII